MLSGYKTYILAIGAALASAYAGVQDGSFSAVEAAQVLEALGLAALRAGLATLGAPSVK